MRIFLFVLASMFLIGLTGCQTMPYEGQARDVKRKPQEEGVVGIPLNFRDEDRQKAETKMQSNCAPGAFKIMEEGEVAVGQQTKSSGKETDRKSTERKVGSLFGMPLISGDAGGKNTESSQVTTDVKEWRISYRCISSNGTPRKTKVR
ncbi:MAG: hypothetical protein AB7F86_15095 [Bdellovibrionales bacterium]